MEKVFAKKKKNSLNYVHNDFNSPALTKEFLRIVKHDTLTKGYSITEKKKRTAKQKILTSVQKNAFTNHCTIPRVYFRGYFQAC